MLFAFVGGRKTPSPRADVPLKNSGGMFLGPVEINGAITLEFGVDSGATDVSIQQGVFSTLKRTRTLKGSDILGKKYALADGSKSQSVALRIRSLKVGDKVVEDTAGTVVPSGATLLLGQLFLSRFKALVYRQCLTPACSRISLKALRHRGIRRPRRDLAHRRVKNRATTAIDTPVCTENSDSDVLVVQPAD
jgi:hypothetical protein